MTNPYPLLSSPLDISSVPIQNRVMMAAHTTRLAEAHAPGTKLRNYHVERARGGVGLIVLEATTVHPSSEPRQRMLYNHHDDVVPAYRQLASAIHEHGTRMVVQLYHAGMHSDGSNNRLPVWAPSPIRSPFYNETPHEMSTEEIGEVVEAFAAAARRVQVSGLDGVEIHAANSYLLEQFLSPATNHRRDAYGGSLENRVRLLLDVLEAVDEACKPRNDFILGVRLGADEFLPGGLEIIEACRIAELLAATGLVSYLSVAAGSYHTQSAMVPPMELPPGLNVPLAARVKAVAGRRLPIVAVGRITHPAQAESILASGQADMIGLARALIADPEWARKAFEDHADDIRPCIGCNQLCVGRMPRDQSISCIHNPAAGREDEWGVRTLRSARQTKKIVVVGGGPAGLEAARVAALRKHELVLFEKSDALGGQANMAAKLPGRGEFGGLVDYLVRQVKKLDVDIRLNREATVELVDAENPDAVVVATGSTPIRSGASVLFPAKVGVPGAELPHVFSVWEAILAPHDLGNRVVVVDEDGHWPGVGTALYLAEGGHQVTIVTRFPSLAPELAPTLSLPLVYSRLRAHGVSWTLHATLAEIAEVSVTVSDIFCGTEQRIEPVDAVVLALGNRADAELHSSLKGRVAELYLIGDALSPRRADMAILEGQKVARAI